MSEFAAVPDPGVTLESALDTIRVLKSNMELMIGSRGNSPTARLFFQTDKPKTNETKIGDFWVKRDTRTLFYWDGLEWQALT